MQVDRFLWAVRQTRYLPALGAESATDYSIQTLPIHDEILGLYQKAYDGLEKLSHGDQALARRALKL